VVNHLKKKRLRKRKKKEGDIIKENKVVTISVFSGFWLFPFGFSSQFSPIPFHYYIFTELTDHLH